MQNVPESREETLASAQLAGLQHHLLNSHAGVRSIARGTAYAADRTNNRSGRFERCLNSRECTQAAFVDDLAVSKCRSPGVQLYCYRIWRCTGAPSLAAAALPRQSRRLSGADSLSGRKQDFSHRQPFRRPRLGLFRGGGCAPGHWVLSPVWTGLGTVRRTSPTAAGPDYVCCRVREVPPSCPPNELR